MKVATNNNNDDKPLTLAELEAYQQFEQSHQEGQTLFRPVVAAGQPAPNCVPFFEKVSRFAITILEGPHSVEGSNWWCNEANGIQTPVSNPLEAAWQAAKSVRAELKRKLGRNTYVIAVAWFPDIEESEDILDKADGRSVHVLFGQVDLVQRLASFPKGDELQTKLSRWQIEQEVAALSRVAEPEPERAAESEPVSGRAGVMNIGRVETMNVYVTIADVGDVAAPPLITVRGP